ncbi:MAG: FHA domain-containing protein [Blastocatellia bacterium]|nr:FHA domain-containing protein [Blastocatellia bacterium]
MNMRNREVKGREIVAAIVGGMLAGLEPLHSRTLAPELFHVYLRPTDYERLRGVFHELRADAARALDERLAAVNKASRRGVGPMLQRLAERLRPALDGLPEEMRPVLTGRIRIEGECVRPENGWQISFFRNEEEDAEPGDIVVNVMLTAPQRPELGAGMSTIHIRTLSRDRAWRITGERREPVEAAAPRVTKPDLAEAERAAAATLRDAQSLMRPAGRDPLATERTILAILRARDANGEQRFEMKKTAIVIGRGGTGVWVDWQLAGPIEVSREHLRIRRDAEGNFHLKDVSTRGATIGGIVVPPSMKTDGDRRVDADLWTPLPPRARIGLAGKLYIDFEAQGAAGGQ